MKRTAHSLSVAAVVAAGGLAVVSALLSASGAWAQPKSSPQDLPGPQSGAAASAAMQASPVANAASGSATAQIERGRHLAEMGDCVACHTRQGGSWFSGGRPLETPFGVVLSANLTPDNDTGIGRYTADTFYRALHEGIDREGRHLYPAFPYNYYTNVTREDTDALYAYFRSLQPVSNKLERNQLPFPFRIRGLMVFWNWMFLDKGPYRPDSTHSAEWNRGAYLAEGLGHCEACHTPKNIVGGPKRSDAFRGGRFAQWFAPDITPNRRTGIGGWNDDALREFLREGRSVHSAASGEMGEVVAFSTSHMDDAELSALSVYLRSLAASPDAHVDAPDAAVMHQGEAIWQDACSACHRMNGAGVPRYFPPIKGNANVQQSDPSTVLHFILEGTRRMPTDRAPTPLAMPAFEWKLDDSQVAAVATYVRNSWGNAAEPVTTKQVADMRSHFASPHAAGDRKTDGGLRQPGPRTFGMPDTDSRDNGTPQAGRAASQSSKR